MKSSIWNYLVKVPLSLTEVLLLLAFFVVLPLGQFERITLNPALSFYLHDLICLVWVFLQLPFILQTVKKFFTNQTARNIWKKWTLETITLGWVSSGVIITFLLTQQLTPLVLFLRLFLYILFSWTVIKKVPRTSYLLLLLLFLSGLIYWWLAFLQFIFVPDTRFLWLLGWDEHYYRMIGTLFDPAFTGILGVLLLLITWKLKNILPKWFYLFAVIAFIIGILLTYSRASYLALAFIFLVFLRTLMKKTLFTRRNIFIGLGCAAIIITAWLFVPRPGGDGVQLLRTTSALDRIRSIKAEVSQVTPLSFFVGSGLFSSSTRDQQNGNLQIPLHSHTPDNIFILLFTQLGIVGLLLVLAVLFKYWKKPRGKFPLVWIALGAMIIHAQFNSTFLQSTVLLFFLLFIQSEIAAHSKN